MISKTLLEAMEEVLPGLEIDKIDVTKSFSDNSIDSLDTMSIFLELKEKGIDFSDEEISSYCETIISTSKYIENR